MNAEIGGDRTYSFITGPPAVSSNRISGTFNLASTSQWQLVVGVMDGLQRRIYVDGILVSENQTTLPNFTASGNDARIGSWDIEEQSDFNGLIDELRIYQTVLFSDDIDALWNNGAGDLGIVPSIDIANLDSTGDINGTIRFLQVGNEVAISDINQSGICIDGGTLTQFPDQSNGFKFIIQPHRPGIPVTIILAKGAANGLGGNTDSEAFSYRFTPSPTITANEDLGIWYSFEGNSTDRILDLGPTQVDASYQNANRQPGKFSQSLSVNPYSSLKISSTDYSFNQEFTLSLWVKILDDDEGILVNNGQVSLMYKDDLSIVGQAFINGEWISVEGPAKFGQWSNYVLTRSSENLSLS